MCYWKKITTLELHALLFADSVWVLLRPTKLWTIIIITICRCHYKVSTFSSVIYRPGVLVRPGFWTHDLLHSSHMLNNLSQPVSSVIPGIYFFFAYPNLWMSQCTSASIKWQLIMKFFHRLLYQRNPAVSNNYVHYIDKKNSLLDL